jgi:hypothetical protein
MGDLKSIKIKLTDKQRTQIHRATGQSHDEVVIESFGNPGVVREPLGAKSAPRKLNARTAPRRLNAKTAPRRLHAKTATRRLHAKTATRKATKYT